MTSNHIIPIALTQFLCYLPKKVPLLYHPKRLSVHHKYKLPPSQVSIPDAIATTGGSFSSETWIPNFLDALAIEPCDSSTF